MEKLRENGKFEETNNSEETDFNSETCLDKNDNKYDKETSSEIGAVIHQDNSTDENQIMDSENDKIFCPYRKCKYKC